MAAEYIGRYKIEYELGQGGMATVYKALDPNFEREVALKVLPPQFLHDKTFRGRFEREAKTIATLEHAAIVPVYDFGEQDEQPYLVMRYMTGGSLSQRMKEKPISLGEAAAIVGRVCMALDEAHPRGIVHRDLKPANILFDRYGDAYLSDFGIAKINQATAALTGSGVIGTPAYMSPEQAYGSSGIDGRSDIYSLGVIIFEMLTGQAPYDADTPMGVAMKHILEPVPRILDFKPDLPQATESVILRALAKDADDRYQKAGELGEALLAVAEGRELPVSAAPRQHRTTQVVAPAGSGKPSTIVMENRPGPVPEAEGWTRTGQTENIPASYEESGIAKAAATGAAAMMAKHERQQRRKSGKRGRFWVISLILVAVGMFTCGALSGVRIPFVGTRPMALVAAIAEHNPAGDQRQQDLVQPVGAEVEALNITLDLTTSHTSLSALAGTSDAVSGTFTTGPKGEDIRLDYEVQGTVGFLTLTQPSGDFQLAQLDLGLTPGLPIDLTVESDAGELLLDLEGLNIRSLLVEGGTGITKVVLPTTSDGLRAKFEAGLGELTIIPPQDSADLKIDALSILGGFGAVEILLPEAGPYDVDITTGLGEVTVTVPDTLEALINLSGMADLNMVNTRFRQDPFEDWATPGYENAADQVTLRVSAIFGNVKVE